MKSYVQTDCLFPKVALVDPELALTVPRDQTAYGVATLSPKKYFHTLLVCWAGYGDTLPGAYL